jgi:hypothetical protein
MMPPELGTPRAEGSVVQECPAFAYRICWSEAFRRSGMPGVACKDLLSFFCVSKYICTIKSLSTEYLGEKRFIYDKYASEASFTHISPSSFVREAYKDLVLTLSKPVSTRLIQVDR